MKHFISAVLGAALCAALMIPACAITPAATGDTSNMPLMIVLAAVAVIAIVVVLIVMNKKKK